MPQVSTLERTPESSPYWSPVATAEAAFYIVASLVWLWVIEVRRRVTGAILAAIGVLVISGFAARAR
jgi:drug/metabolite transporter superfamily protein YnfA